MAMARWWWVALGAASFAAGRAWSRHDPGANWVTRNGEDWRTMSPAAQTAYAEGFLAGSAFGQAAAESQDSAGLTQAMAGLRRDGRFRLPYGANVYITKINDYYWWDNHRARPLWYAFWEVNTSLTGPMNDSTR
jgi:hypothetical protein